LSQNFVSDSSYNHQKLSVLTERFERLYQNKSVLTLPPPQVGDEAALSFEFRPTKFSRSWNSYWI